MTINAADVLMALNTIGDRWRTILGPGAHDALARARSMVQGSTSIRLRSSRGRFTPSSKEWGFRIDPDRPLVLKETVVDGIRLRPDLLVSASWSGLPAVEPTSLNIALRVWCLSSNVYFRDDWDASRLLGEINSSNGRVMLRVHFDLANEGQPGPRHHVQVGGVPHSGEFSWFPEVLSVPRLLHMPMDLVLAIEMIAATFYKADYDRVRREPSWIHCRKKSEAHLLTAYLQRATNAIQQGNSVMESLWNVPWQ